MIRATAVPDRCHNAMVVSSALALVVILVAHVVVMATPLHDLLMQPEWPRQTASMHQSQDADNLAPGPQLAAMGDVGDCAIVWTVLARRAPGFLVAAAVVATLSVVPLVFPYGPPPLPRTLSPPLGADRQALLQVFRI